MFWLNKKSMQNKYFALGVLFLLSISYAINIDFYYGIGCPHCAATEKIFEKLGEEYELNITWHEVYYDSAERQRMFKEYERFGLDPMKGGVPTTIVDGKSFVVGELKEEHWRELFDLCEQGKCPEEVISEKDFANKVEEKDTASTLTWPVLIGAAIVDSINPCTIAIMVLLLSTIMYTKGRKETLSAGILFAGVIFIMYILYGLGIIKAITTLEITHIFYAVVTLGALALAIMELNAYFNYKPGFFAVEMPMFLRPYARKVTENATSPFGVVAAAMFCSLFLIPCSSGPYLMVLGMIAKAVTLKTLTYLVVYNLFFIAPMVIITLLIYFGRTTVEKIGEAKEKYIKHLHLISGIILLGLFLIMMNELIKYI